jgi:hypothetical protein
MGVFVEDLISDRVVVVILGILEEIQLDEILGGQRRTGNRIARVFSVDEKCNTC